MASDGANRRSDAPSEEAVRALLGEIAPGSVALVIDSLPGDFSNHTHLVEARSADGPDFRFVVRRYAVFGDYDRAEKARREFKTFELLQRNGIPAPRPLYLDDAGAVLGTPGIVTSYVPGELVFSPPPDPMTWTRSLAMTLADIHSVPCDTAVKGFLLDANAEVSWFLRSGSVPDWMRAHPDGAAVWQTAHTLWKNIEHAPAGLVHIDYWPGNILWHKGRIAAVVDWEEAAYGDPAIDVAYCRMDMFLAEMGDAADDFLSVYETRTGRRVRNLGLWELAAAARPMFSPEGRITESPAKENFRRFVAGAIRRAS